MEIYLWEACYHGDYWCQIVAHVPETDLWFCNDAYSGENITSCNFTELFWESIQIQEEDMLTKIGDL